MVKQHTAHWAGINEVTFLAGIRFLLWIAKVFGRWPFRLFLYPVIFWYMMTSPIARKASRDYLEHLSSYGNMLAMKPGFWRILSHFMAFGENILDKLLVWSGSYPLDSVLIHGTKPFDDYLLRKQGCLLICSHSGNIELCKVLSQQQPGLKVTMLVHTYHAQAFNRLLEQISPDSQFSMIQVTDMSPEIILTLHERIRQGEFIVIAGDRIPVSDNQRTVSVDFLGGKAAFPIGPYVLASLLDCPVHLMFATKNAGQDEIHFELFREKITMPARKERDAFFYNLASDYAARLGHYCLMAPLQWFNFYPFWDDQ